MKKAMIPLLLASVMVGAAACGITHKPPAATGFTANAVFKKDDYQKIVSPQNQLGFDLLPEAKRDPSGNLFISPTSLLMALSMVYNGADGGTKEEMAKVLHAEGMEPMDLNKSNASLMSMLKQDSVHNPLKVANSIWLNNQFHFQKDFSKTNQDYFNAKIKAIDTSNSRTPKVINDWVSESTNGKIKKIVDDPLSSDFVAMLINAIYFKGNWEHPFDKKLTEKRPFHLNDGSTIDVPLMTLKEKLGYIETESFQAVSLPYSGEKMSMKVLLPKEGSSLAEFEKELTNENWLKWNEQFSSMEGTVLLPKFKLEYSVLLNEPLQKLGMATAFGTQANFAKMIQENDPIWIDFVKQKTYIDVNEEGTEAAAVTGVGMTKAAAPQKPFYMEINRPFFLAITDNQTGAILFMGEIAKP